MSLKAIEILLAIHDAQGSARDGLSLYKRLEKATRINVKKLGAAVDSQLERLRGWKSATANHPGAQKLRSVAALRGVFK